MHDLSHRATAREKMDDPAVPEGEVRKALREIALINKWLGGYRIIKTALAKIKWPSGETVIMDVGCGGGDALRVIADWAAKKKRQPLKLIGVDINPAITRYAGNQSLQYPHIVFRTADVFD